MAGNGPAPVHQLQIGKYHPQLVLILQPPGQLPLFQNPHGPERPAVDQREIFPVPLLSTPLEQLAGGGDII